MIYALIGVGALIALVVLLLCVRLKVVITYDDKSNELWCTVHYLFIRYVLLPEKESTKYKREEKLLKKGKELNWNDGVSLEGIYGDEGVLGFLEVLRLTLKNTWDLLLSFLKRASIKTFDIRMNIVGKDAADTALIYGYANSIIYPIVSAVIESAADCKKYNVLLNPDFTDNADSSVDIKLIARISLFKVIAALLECGVEAENLLVQLSKNPKHTKENAK